MFNLSYSFISIQILVNKQLQIFLIAKPGLNFQQRWKGEDPFRRREGYCCGFVGTGEGTLNSSVVVTKGKENERSIGPLRKIICHQTPVCTSASQQVSQSFSNFDWSSVVKILLLHSVNPSYCHRLFTVRSRHFEPDSGLES